MRASYPLTLALLCLLSSPALGDTVLTAGVIDGDTVWSGRVLLAGMTVVKKGAVLTIEPDALTQIVAILLPTLLIARRAKINFGRTFPLRLPRPTAIPAIAVAAFTGLIVVTSLYGWLAPPREAQGFACLLDHAVGCLQDFLCLLNVKPGLPRFDLDGQARVLLLEVELVEARLVLGHAAADGAAFPEGPCCPHPASPALENLVAVAGEPVVQDLVPGKRLESGRASAGRGPQVLVHRLML